jgi:hypothetical protein
VCVICRTSLAEFLYAADKKFTTCLLQVAGSLKAKKSINGIRPCFDIVIKPELLKCSTSFL